MSKDYIPWSRWGFEDQSFKDEILAEIQSVFLERSRHRASCQGKLAVQGWSGSDYRKQIPS